MEEEVSQVEELSPALPEVPGLIFTFLRSLYLMFILYQLELFGGGVGGKGSCAYKFFFKKI